MAGANRKAPRLGGAKPGYTDKFTIKDAEHIYVGEMISRDASGEAVSTTDTASEVVLGVATKEVDNTDDGLYAENISIAVHRMDNDVDGAATAFSRADIGAYAYALDATTVTVAASASNDIVAGVVVDVDSDGVYVDFDPGKRP
jgi:hypothetical protein